jgi:hypothetical protein
MKRRHHPIVGPVNLKDAESDNELWSSLASRYMKPKAEEPRALPPEVPWTVQDIVDAVNRAVTAAYKRHKERGESIVIWRDGKIVTLGPDEIEI